MAFQQDICSEVLLPPLPPSTSRAYVHGPMLRSVNSSHAEHCQYALGCRGAKQTRVDPLSRCILSALGIVRRESTRDFLSKISTQTIKCFSAPFPSIAPWIHGVKRKRQRASGGLNLSGRTGPQPQIKKRQIFADSPLSAPGKRGRPRHFQPDFNQMPWNPVKIRLKFS